MFWLSFQAALSAFYDTEQGEPAGVGVGGKEPAVLPQTTPTTSTSKGLVLSLFSILPLHPPPPPHLPPHFPPPPLPLPLIHLLPHPAPSPPSSLLPYVSEVVWLLCQTISPDMNTVRMTMKTLRNFMLGALSTGDCYWCFEAHLKGHCISFCTCSGQLIAGPPRKKPDPQKLAQEVFTAAKK